MAVRIHVTASHAAVDDIRAVFTELLGPPFENISLEQSGPWTFFSTSVWSASGALLLDGLNRLNAVGLQATTEDACKWYLTVAIPGHGSVSFLHDFYLFRRELDSEETAESPEAEEIDPRLTFLQPDPEPGELRPPSQFDSVSQNYADAQIPIAEQFLDEVRMLNYGEAVNRFRHYEAQRLAIAMAAAGIEFDRGDLTDALLWNSTTAREDHADIGNLPRVLLALGLAGTMRDYVQQCDEQEELIPRESEAVDENSDACNVNYDDLASRAESQEDAEANGAVDERKEHGLLIKRTLAIAEQSARLPIEGDVVSLIPQEWSLLGFFAEAVSVQQTPTAVVRIVFSSLFDTTGFTVNASTCWDIEAQCQPDGCLLGLQSLDLIDLPDPECPWPPDYLLTYLGEPMARFLRQPADGTFIEFLFAEPDQPSTVMRLAGRIVDGTLQITEAFPKIDSSKLSAALELARDQETCEYSLKSPAEAAAVMESVKLDSYLHNMGVTLEGQTLRCEYDGMGFLARLILWERLGDVWNFQPARAQRVIEYAERRKWQLEMQRAAVQMRKMQRAPCDKSSVIFRGVASLYWKSDMSSWENLESGPREDFDRAMAELDFQLLGDFVSRKLRDHLLRCFCSPDQLCFAVIIGNSCGYAGYEFVSHFQNGAHLTTSTSWMADSHPEIEVYAQCLPGLAPLDLYQRHRWGISRFESHKETRPILLEPTLQCLVRLFDAMLERMSTVNSNLVNFESVSLDDGV